VISADSSEGTKITIGLLGASFDTGNLGVSALAESSIKCILHRWPDAEIVLIAGSREAGECKLRINNRDVLVKKLPIRISKNIFLSNHFLVFLFYAVLLKVIPWRGYRSLLVKRNPYVKSLIETDFVADVSGGDSFSEIYGIYRFMFVVVFKWLVIFFGKPLILLPQTYGPFKSWIAKSMARYILKRAQIIFSRDKTGADYLRSVFGNKDFIKKVIFVSDIAFVLDSRKPKHLTIEPSANIREQNSIVIGLNISGLLFNGGYTRDNMFGLKTDYRALVQDIVKMFLEDENVIVLLVPHMFPHAIYKVESDPEACLRVYEQLRQIYPGKIFIVKGQYDQGEIKHIIGMCDFFVGSRMHACIAALSQCIPSVGIAYSKKFHGVFDSIGLSRCVVDAGSLNEEEALSAIKRIFSDRDSICERLRDVVPKAKEEILGIFKF
jgi:polysaccharide pyruvyl transferase WcaK-like protein